MFELTEGGDGKDRELVLEDYKGEQYDRLKALFLDGLRKELRYDISEKYDGKKLSAKEMKKTKQYGAYITTKRDGELQNGDEIVSLLLQQSIDCLKAIGGKVLYAGLIVKEGTLTVYLDASGEAIETDEDGYPPIGVVIADVKYEPIYTVGWKVCVKTLRRSQNK